MTVNTPVGIDWDDGGIGESPDTWNLDDIDSDKEWVNCERHASCQLKGGTLANRYETLTSFYLRELDDEQRAFITWFEAVT